MSGLNNSPSPLSTTSNQSEDSVHTSSYESESNESDEREDSRLKVPSIPSPRMVEAASPTSVKFDQSVAPRITFQNSLKHKGVSPAPMYGYQGKDQLCPVMFSPASVTIRASWDKPNSPAVSYNSMTSVQSMNPPLKFSREPDVVGRKEAASPAPTMASVQSEQSMDPPATFSCRLKVPSIPSPRMVDAASPGPTSVRSDLSVIPRATIKVSESYTSLMMREHLRCSVCKDMLKEPVSIPCGHSFCQTCILSYWTKPIHAGSYSCPQCRKRFKTCPALSLNLTLANVVQTQQQAGFSPALLPQSYAGPGDVACDICSESSIRAVKSCLTCCTSYCETHVRRHYTVEALQEHILREPTKDLEQEVYKTNTPVEVGLKDLKSNMMNEMKQLENTVNKMTVKLEDLQRSITQITEAQHPRKSNHTEDFVFQVLDFAVPDFQLPQE
ncbi:uncharacterized protein LOC113547393 [Pangasianodon hypophthalmus]|nr:uncharacterized protein LOC113547393 [Pangasianodon hypophthalmus]